ATFSSPYGVKWSCNATMSVCGVLVADYGYNAVRFVAIEAMSTTTAALSDEGSVTSSVSHDASSTSYSSTLATSRTRSSGSHSSVVGPSATNIVSMTSSTSLSRSGTTQSTATLSRRLSVTSTTSKSISSSSSITMNASWSRSATAGAAASHTMGATLSLATVGAAASITPTTLTSHSKTASVSNTRTKASRSHSGTQRSVSPSASTHCALVAADGAASLGSLNPFDAGTIINDELPAGTVLDTSAASLSRAALLRPRCVVATALHPWRPSGRLGPCERGSGRAACWLVVVPAADRSCAEYAALHGRCWPHAVAGGAACPAERNVTAALAADVAEHVPRRDAGAASVAAVPHGPVDHGDGERVGGVPGGGAAAGV
ncbi:Hypothetical protein, putative, partial [Bodo saltans]